MSQSKQRSVVAAGSANHPITLYYVEKRFDVISSSALQMTVFNPFQSNFFANPILPSSYSPSSPPFSYSHNCANTTQSSVQIKTHGLPRNRNRAICWLKSVLFEEKCRTGSDSGAGEQTQQKNVSDVTRLWSERGKS